MKTLNCIITILLGLFIIVNCSLLVSCAKKAEEQNKQLFTPDLLSAKDSEYLKQRGFLVENEKIIYVYYTTKIADGGNLLTDQKVVAFQKDSEEKEPLQNIFDLSTTHALAPEENSTITVYRKDDTDFICAFPGGLDIDDKFFSELRTLWRNAISEKQAEKETDTTAGVILGVKNKEDAEKALKVEVGGQ